MRFGTRNGPNSLMKSHMARFWREFRGSRNPETLREYAKTAAHYAATILANREKRASAASNPSGSCQICGRQIKFASGLIAHHGYRRPGHGWQTASCYGARYQPYEIAHDALDRMIPEMASGLRSAEERYGDFLTFPPPTLRYNRFAGSYTRPAEWIELPRPEGFTPGGYHDRPGTYQYHYSTGLSALANEIRQRWENLNYLRDRRANWTPPSSEGG